MQFNSYPFLLAYLPILVIGYFSLCRLNKTAGKIYLTAGSALFYLYGGLASGLIFFSSILVNYSLAKILTAAGNHKKAVLSLALGANIALLFYFKYFNFFLSGVHRFLSIEFTPLDVILPLGISFFTFQQLMYLLNIWNGNISTVILSDYLAYILYFPKLLMGPLAEPSDLIDQLNDPKRKQADWDHIAQGLKIFSFGLFKKLILADTFIHGVTWGFSNLDTASSADLLLVMLSYTFEIYFDFSGYSDMAVGVSTMLNIDLPMNFNSPYKALSIRDFWKRWHMTLTGFFTRYLYIPLGGSRKGRVRTCVNTLLVFLVSGLWHGANRTFLLWGLLHGVFSLGERFLEKISKKIPRLIRWVLTFIAINLLWLLFRAESISQWFLMLGRIFSLESLRVSEGLLRSFTLPETPFLFRLLHLEALNSLLQGGLSLLIFMVAGFFLCLVPENNYRKLKTNNIFTLFLAAAAMIWSVLCLSSESVFVYLNF